MKKKKKILNLFNILISTLVYITTFIFGIFFIFSNSIPSKELVDTYTEVAKASGFETMSQIQKNINDFDFQKIVNFFYRIRNLVAILVQNITYNLFKLSLSCNFEKILISCKYYYSKQYNSDKKEYKEKQESNYLYFDNFSNSRKFLVNCILTC